MICSLGNPWGSNFLALAQEVERIPHKERIKLLREIPIHFLKKFLRVHITHLAPLS
jgi:hypothetical protein